MSLYSFDSAFRREGIENIAGIDEAGRGPMAGPLTAACIILPESFRLPGLDDSKRLSASTRERLFEVLTRVARSYSIISVSSDTVDELNVYRAAYMAMKKALLGISLRPDMVLVDGPRKLDVNIPQASIVGGDGKSACIAAASILAKVARDRLMGELDREYPQYGFSEHKGYCTREHRIKLRKFGPSPVHRKSFAPVRQWRFL